MDSHTDWVVIGRFGRPHGIKGYTTVISFTEPRENILHYPDWYGYINKLWQPIRILHIEVTHKHILAQIESYSLREQVAALTNIDIAIQKEKLPALSAGEYYWHELVGMHVVTKDGVTLGRVTEIMPTGSNDVLVVVGEKRHLIPYLMNTFVLSINDSLRSITVDWDVDF